MHIQGEKQEGASQRDFDIKINMLPLFLDQSQNNNSNNNNTNNSGNKWNYVRLVADSEPAYRGKHDPSTSPVVKGGLDEWAKRFCKETSMKSYVSVPLFLPVSLSICLCVRMADISPVSH